LFWPEPGTGLRILKHQRYFFCTCVLFLLTYLLLLHPFNGIFSRTTLVSRCQKGKTSLDVNEATHDGVWGWQWHQLDHMQTICTSLQTDNHTNTSSLNFYRPDALFLMPIQHCQSTEGIFTYLIVVIFRFILRFRS